MVTSRLVDSTVLSRNAVTEEGSGEQTILFSHGFGGNQSAWDAQAAAFRERFRIIRLDHVGCGRSDFAVFHPMRYRSLFNYANDLLEVCEALRLEKAIFIGHSMGAMICLLASLLAPEFFSQLVMIGANPRYLKAAGYDGGFAREDVEKIYAFAAADYASWVSGFAPLMIGEDKPELASYLAGTLKEMRPDIALSLLRIMLESDHRSELPQVTVPTSIIQSRHDAAVPIFVGRHLHEHIPNSRYLELNTSGHLPHLTAPELVNAAVESILAP